VNYLVTWGYMNQYSRKLSTFEAALYEYTTRLRMFEKERAAGSRSATSPSIYGPNHDDESDGLSDVEREAVELA
jgi:hypothetical protein